MSRLDRIERINAIEKKLMNSAKGWSRAELARDLNVDRSTIKRDIDYILAKSLFPIEIVNNRIFIQKDAHVSQIEMNLDEMLALHQAVRLLVRKSSFISSHYITLLNKLVHALTFHSPVISKCILDTAESINSGLNKKEIIKRTELLETLNRAWTHQNKILLTYRKKDSVKQYVCGIYCFEPNADGFSLHIIAMCDGEYRLRDFKFERIEAAKELNTSYSIPESFNPHDYFRDSWGIWVTGKSPIKVVLHFSKEVTDRIRENCWHLSEKKELQEDGSLIWTAEIAEPKEMLPWVRSWGDQVRIIEGMEI